jgi:FixJ family two-component response regulator
MPGVPRGLFSPAILLIDADTTTCEIVESAFIGAGFDVDAVASGREGLVMARSRGFDLLVIELRLPDMLGTDVIRTLRNEGVVTPFVIVSACLTTAVTVEAMKLGAENVLEKPVCVDDLLATLRSAFEVAPKRSRRRMTAPPARREARAVTREARPGSAAERWARHVVNACASDGDLKTLASWAKFIGVSCSSLCESCRMIGIRPHDARDFARVLRALMQSGVHHCSPYMLLDVSDRRTLRNLVERAGLRGTSPMASVSVEQFFSAQRLIPRDHEGVKRLRSILVPTRSESLQR